MTTQDEARIQARYPKRSALDYLMGAGAGLALLGAIGLVVANGVLQSNPPVTAMVRGFEVLSPTEAVAEVVVQRRDPAVTVECALYAQAMSYEKVGETTFTVEPGSDKLTRVEVNLKTVKEATTVTMEEPPCKVAG